MNTVFLTARRYISRFTRSPYQAFWKAPSLASRWARKLAVQTRDVLAESAQAPLDPRARPTRDLQGTYLALDDEYSPVMT
jgi:hypothetical protein